MKKGTEEIGIFFKKRGEGRESLDVRRAVPPEIGDGMVFDFTWLNSNLIPIAGHLDITDKASLHFVGTQGRPPDVLRSFGEQGSNTLGNDRG